jgi:hypothetical protein
MSDYLIDETIARKFFELLHARASHALSHLRKPGILQLVSVAPDSNGMTISPFLINDIDAMLEASLADAQSGRNVFVELRTVRPGRPRERGRGKIESTIGCFGFGIDHDNDTGKAGHVNGSDTTVIETSPDNFQELIFLGHGLNAGTAKPLGDTIRAGSGGADHCSGTITGCFRIPGLPNFPNAKKRQRGRVVVQAKLVRVSDKLWTPDEIRAAYSTAKTQAAKPRPIGKPAGALKSVVPSPSTRHRTRVAKAKISATVNSKTDRSAAFQSAVNAAARAGLSRSEIETEMRAHPGGPQQKYLEGTDRLTREIDRSLEKVEQQQAEEQAQRDAEHAERVEAGKDVDGAEVLNQVYEFLGRFVCYPSKDARVAHVLWIAHAHLMHCWDTTPRLTFMSPEPGSGKSRALELCEALTPSPILISNCTPAYLFRRAAQEQVTLLVDEADTVFSVKSEGSEKIRAFLNASHRRGNSAGYCIGQGTNITPEDSPCFVAVALAALALSHMPETVMSRSIIIHMRRRAPTEVISPWRRRKHEAAGNALRDRLALWAAAVTDQIKQWLDGDLIDMPDGIADRDADVWEPLFLIADAAGDHWPDTARATAVTQVTAQFREGATASWGLRLLSDLRQVLGNDDSMFTVAILDALAKIEESPWGDIKGKPLSDRGLAERLRPYGIKSKLIRVGSTVARGYSRGDFLDAWSRYLKPSGD